MSKIAIVTSYIATPHYETELELMQNHINKGNEIFHIICNQDWNVCLNLSNSENKYASCKNCIGKRETGLAYIKGGKIKKVRLFNQKNNSLLDDIESVNDIDELKKVKVENFDVGMAVLSTLVSSLKTPYFNLKDYLVYINESIKTAISVYYAMREYLKSNKFEYVYIFNGRFFIERAILRACEYEKQNFYTHERGCDKNHYELFFNTLPHSINYKIGEIKKYWNEEINESIRTEKANSFFNNRMNNISRAWVSFLDKQKSHLLPKSWQSDKHNIIIFTTSENEYFAIGDEWKPTIYTNQLHGILELAQSIRELNDTSYRFYIRMHPNLINYPPEYSYTVKQLEQVQDIFEVILPDSEISSYALMQECDKVLTFGSSMGLEATYHGKPSILLSTTFYQSFDITYNPSNHLEAMSLILNKNLKAKPKINTLPVGFYLETYGIPYKYYQPETLFSGKFNEKYVHNIADNKYLAKWFFFKQNIKHKINKILGKKFFEVYA
ncbi:MAG: hypothetical protein SFU27_03310 [Thermonemataceae bacterium]|nr:hypothetical protein [Thermonemataceae bacterium]